jgi:hypothetical protein
MPWHGGKNTHFDLTKKSIVYHKQNAISTMINKNHNFTTSSFFDLKNKLTQLLLGL